MKSILTLATVSLIATACGSNSSTSELAAARQPSSTRHAYALQGHIQAVDTQFAKAPATGMWTEVTISYQVPCSAKLESFSYRLNNSANHTEILASAVASSEEISGAMNCQSIAVVQKKVSLPGIYAATNIGLVNLDSATDKIVVPAATTSFSTIAPIEITNVQPMCPNGEKCLVNGTEVTIVAHLGCVDTLGPVTYSAEQNTSDSKLQLAVSAVNMVHKNSANTQCFAENTETTKITLINQFVDSSDINLVIIK